MFSLHKKGGNPTLIINFKKIIFLVAIYWKLALNTYHSQTAAYEKIPEPAEKVYMWRESRAEKCWKRLIF
jgi:hypothetical protein